MAQNLATASYTLASFKANVRNQSGTMSQQESGIIETQMNDIVHNAILLVRSLMGRMVDGFYITNTTLGSITITSGYGTITIATYSIADVNGISLYDATLKEIPVLPVSKFNAIRTLYSLTTTQAIASVFSTSGTPNILSIAIATGAVGPLTTVQINYPRNPVKVSADADTIDIPDYLVPIAQDIATVSIFRKLSKAAPSDLEGRVVSFINSQLGQLNLGKI